MQLRYFSFGYTFLLLLISLNTAAQNGSVGIGTNSPNANAVLDLVAPNGNQGLLPPRLTTSQRTAFGGILGAADRGMTVFDADANGYFFWTGTAWQALGGGSSSYSAGTGITINGSNQVSNTGVLNVGGATGALSLGTGLAVSGSTLGINVDNTTLGLNGSGQLEVKNDGITSDKIAAGAVGTDEIQNGTIALADLSSMGATATGQVLKWDMPGFPNQWSPAADDGATLGGDVTGPVGTNVVEKIQAIPVSPTDPTTGQVLRYNGTAWEPFTVTSLGATTQYHSIDATTFTGTGEKGQSDKFFITRDGEVAYQEEVGGTLKMTAPVLLSDGAVLDHVVFYYQDKTPNSITFKLFRKDLTSGGASTQLGTDVLSTSNTGFGSVTLDLTGQSADVRTIDNSKYTYRVLVELGDASSKTDVVSSVNHGVHGVVIRFTK